MDFCFSECSVALVDDQADSIDLMRYAIKTTFPRAHVTARASGEALLASLPTERPNAVVTRQKLSGSLDGVSLIRALRSAGFAGPIVMITNSPELEKRAFEAGANDFLTFDLWSELPSRLANLLALGCPPFPDDSSQ